MKKLLMVFLLLALFPVVSSAQIDREVTRSVKVHFRQGAVVLDENYMDNKATMSEFVKEVKAYYSDSTARFRQIRVVSSASPEGGKAINDRIAKQRAEAITQWISREIAVDLDYAVESTGIDWELLKELIIEDEGVPYRDEVLELLERVPAIVVENGKEVEVRYNELKALRNGTSYRWIYANIFPKLRYASACCEFWWETIPELLVDNTPVRLSADGGAAVIPFGKTVEDKVVPTVQAADGWVNTLVPTDKTVTFDVAPNPSSEPRTTAVTIGCYGKQYVVPVEQEGATPTMRLTSACEVSYPAAGAEDEITFEKRVDDGLVPVVKSSADWIDSIVPTDKGITYIVKENPTQEPRTATITVESYNEEHKVTVNQLGAEPKCKPFYMAIKTNMLYDVAAIPNIGAEFYLGKNFSIAANYAHAWWKKDTKNLCWRYYGADASLRWWFGKASRIKPLQGHHIGLNYQILTYDFELGDKGIMAGMPNGNLTDRANHIVALEYGYSLPIARRLNIDFSIGVGYHWGIFEEYIPVDGHNVWQATKRRQYFGPTKLEISLVWLIGCENYNKNKGGKR
jgi:hypothetical protein